jgi:hypothetical protein
MRTASTSAGSRPSSRGRRRTERTGFNRLRRNRFGHPHRTTEDDPLHLVDVLVAGKAPRRDRQLGGRPGRGDAQQPLLPHRAPVVAVAPLAPGIEARARRSLSSKTRPGGPWVIESSPLPIWRALDGWGVRVVPGLSRSTLSSSDNLNARTSPPLGEAVVARPNARKKPENEACIRGGVHVCPRCSLSRKLGSDTRNKT